MISIQGLTKKYRKKTALDGVSLELSEGVYGLLGPNGSGKTTLMRCIVGVERPTQGSVEVGGTIGYLPQKFGMYRQLKVYETMELFAASRDLSPTGLQPAIMDCLEKVNLADRAQDKLGSLSGGMLRRLGVAQAFLGNPDLVLLDEPTAGLDPEERRRFKQMIQQHPRKGTVLISTHIVEDLEEICDRIVILAEGRVRAQGTVQELVSGAKMADNLEEALFYYLYHNKA